MARLIDANALDATIESLAEKYERTGRLEAAKDYRFCQTVLGYAPTVDAKPVMYGCWYKAPHHPYRCSNCGETALLDMYGESHYRSNYCPNCGADMRDGDGNG